jgi:hypothetical protein
VVVGRHVEQLEFLDVLLGDRPPLTAPETFYQRMLANDPVEVADQADQCRKTMSLTDYYDDVILPGLLLAQADATAERLSVARQVQIRDATEIVIEDLGEDEDASTSGRGRWHFFGQAPKNDESGQHNGVDDVGITPVWRQDGAIVCIGGRGPLDDCAALMLAQLLAKRGLGARSESFEMLSKAHIDTLDIGRARLICLSCLDGSSAAYLRFALRRVRRRAPRAMILIGAWWLQARESDTADELRSLTDPISTTLVDALRHCLASASALTEEELTGSPEPASTELPKAS